MACASVTAGAISATASEARLITRRRRTCMCMAWAELRAANAQGKCGHMATATEPHLVDRAIRVTRQWLIAVLVVYRRDGTPEFLPASRQDRSRTLRRVTPRRAAVRARLADQPHAHARHHGRAL